MINRVKIFLSAFIILMFYSDISIAQFIDEFNSDSIENWNYSSGDGEAIIKFNAKDGYAEINVDASEDVNNVWWTLIRRDVTSQIDLSLLVKDDYELRIEAKVKVSSAPKRINLHLNTQRTTDFHSHLMEYEIPDTNNWHIVSMTTNNFDVISGDTVNAQLALMDWGFGNYFVQLDYFKVDVVKKNSASNNDLGNIIPYHPDIPTTEKFNTHQIVSEAAIISQHFKRENFNNWRSFSSGNSEKILTLNNDQIIILKWNLEKLKDVEINESGLLEIRIDSYLTGEFSIEELGQIRLVEIMGGARDWDKETVSYENFMKGESHFDVFNSQPIYDLELNLQKSDRKYLTISKYVMRRILSEITLGLALTALGPITASMNVEGKNAPKLHFNAEKK